MDFTSGVEKVDLSWVADGLEFIGNDAFSGTAGEVRFDAATMTIQVDLDGGGSADGSIKLFTADFGAGDLIL